MRLSRSISSSRRPSGRYGGQKGQSLVEMALMMIPLLMLAGVAGDGARMFFISQSVTNSAREGALYFTQHGMEATWTAGALTTQIEKVMGAEDQGSNTAYHCPSWPASPGAAPDTASGGVQIAYSAGIPVAPGTTLTPTITTRCNVTPVLASGFWPLPKPIFLPSVVRTPTLAPQCPLIVRYPGCNPP